MKFIYTQTKTGEWEKSIKDLTPYITHCRNVISNNDYSSSEASLCLPSDEGLLLRVIEMVKKKRTKELKYVIVVGVGGSNLGTKAIYDALGGSLDQFTPDTFPKMLFLDSIDPKATNSILQFLEKNIKNENEFIISIISKSGGTTEPLVNAEILLGALKKRFAKWKERCVIITNNASPLRNEAKKQEIDVLEMPKKVGGRYSIFSAVGLFPLAMAGVNIKSLLDGAKKMRDMCVSEGQENYAKISSIFHYLFLEKGKNIHITFFFHPEMESLGKWYRQLVGESIGKDGKGITPIVSIGSVDHHSMVQLYWGGPSDKTTELVYLKKTQDCFVPEEAIFPSLNAVKGKNTSEIMSAIQKGTALTYKKIKEPFFEIALEEMNEYELGGYMQYKMMEIMYLANLMQINAFDQPQVELYKIETKKILTNTK